MQQKKIPDLLFDRSRAAVRVWPKGYAEILECLVWMMDDYGAEVLSAIETWLQSDDYDKVRVALAFEDVFPFKHAAEMEAVLAIVAARWPDLAVQCRQLIDRRANLKECRPEPADVEQRVARLQEKLQRIIE